jgi:uncharacterized membrane protein YphA (DoxX/SURF4 family)
METWKRTVEWVLERRDMCFDLVRIYLGIGLFVKGVYFMSATETLTSLVLKANNYEAFSTLLVHYVALAHVSGGLFMAVGIITRLSALAQIPILFGAVFLVHLKEGLFSQGQSLEFSALVLFLLCLVLIYGSGRLSLDHYLEMKKAEAESAR